MKTLIVYTSNHGTTEKVAYMISSEMQALGSSSIEVIPLKQIYRVDINSFDQIIIGTSIHAGNPPSEMTTYLDKSMNFLLTKRCALYLIGMNEKEIAKSMDKAFPKKLREHSIETEYLGGEFIFEKMNFIERTLVRRITGFKKSVSLLKTDKIKSFAKKLVP
ncbi:MAG: flavodoxin domain-containing protein [Bacteroidales bacterium]|nr:flavodoxin domain-containing protein [Bacteroidales bacterium]